MKYFGLAIISLVIPVCVGAQVERVLQVQTTPEETENVQYVDSQEIYFEAILLSNQATSTQVDTETSSTTSEIDSSEGATSTPDFANEGEAQQENEALSALVGEINNRYQDAQESCQTGSWLENILCRIRNWW